MRDETKFIVLGMEDYEVGHDEFLNLLLNSSNSPDNIIKISIYKNNHLIGKHTIQEWAAIRSIFA